MQNGLIGWFNGSHHRAALDLYVFGTFTEMPEYTEQELLDYNETAPHECLGDLTPVEYQQLHTPGTSSYAWT
ncbi:putative transposase [Thioalkalivibrio sp. ALE21]|nr:putative transposase [Thioalkalivibrio sp. ALE21]